MRLPRVILAFLTGAALATGGGVMQFVLQNPLASPFGLGVSSGAGLGAALVIVLGLASAEFGAFLLPAVSLCFAFGTVFFVLLLSARLGSFSMREWSAVWVLLPVTVLACLFFLRYAKEFDVMAFGEEQAMAMGVDLPSQAELIESLRNWTANGERCVLGVFHDISLALAFADTALLIDQGSKFACGPVEEMDLSLIDGLYGMDVRRYMKFLLERWD